MSEKCPEADTGTHPSCLYALEGISIAPQLALAATANYVRGRNLEAPRRSERAKELNQIALLLAGQLGAEHQMANEHASTNPSASNSVFSNLQG
jgi:hypothetical protein